MPSGDLLLQLPCVLGRTGVKKGKLLSFFLSVPELPSLEVCQDPQLGSDRESNWGPRSNCRASGRRLLGPGGEREMGNVMSSENGDIDRKMHRGQGDE